MSISIEMSGHFGFLHVMHHLVEVTLESLFQAVFGLAYILFLASSAGDAVDEVVAVAPHFVFLRYFLPVTVATTWPSVFNKGQYQLFRLVQVLLTGLVGSLSSEMGVSFDLTSRSRRLFGLR